MSGVYEIIDPDGRHTGESRIMTKGHVFPPTILDGQSYQLVRPIREGRFGSNAATMLAIENTRKRFGKALQNLAKKQEYY